MCLRALSKYKPPGAYIRSPVGDLTALGFWHYEFEGLIFGGGYFRNFSVFPPIKEAL